MMLVAGEQQREAASPTISVIVPTFNRAALLRETVESILAQTFQDFELIIVDNMSTDGTEGYVSHIADNRIHYLRNNNNGVIAVNRNLGIKAARGEYVALCDDDDLWLPIKLEKQLAVMQADPEIILCYSNALLLLGNEPLKGLLVKRRHTGQHFKRLLRGNLIPNSSVLVRKSVIDDLGGFDEDPLLKGAEDYETWLRAAFRGRFCYLDEGLIQYRIHPENVSTTLRNQAEKNLRVLRKIKTKLALPWRTVIAFITFQYIRRTIYAILGK